jgi:hypothetical protein
MKRFTTLIFIVLLWITTFGQNKIEPTGNVGIGTTSPVTNLHIPSDGATIGQSSLKNSFLLVGSTTNGIGFDDNEIFKLGKDLFLGTGDQNALRLRTNSKDALFINSSGNIGIGTTSPASRLTIAAKGVEGLLLAPDLTNSSRSTRLLISDNKGANSIFRYNNELCFATGAQEGQTSGQIRMRILENGKICIGSFSNKTTGNLMVKGDGADQGVTVWNESGASTLRLWADATKKIGYLTRGDNVLRGIALAENGYIGMGATSPEANLHVSSNTSGDAVVLIESDTDNNNESDNPSLRLRQDEGRVTGILGLSGNAESEYNGALANALYVKNSSGFGIQLATNNKAQLTILPSGNIGIGTTTPSTKLDVAGTIRATEIKVEAQTADYVFGDDYPLRDLNQVEAFIKEHKHLPDIPSAAEMEASGVNLAEMNKLLLQKIEELTLYTLQQEEQIKEKDERLDLLEQRLEKIENIVENQ